QSGRSHDFCGVELMIPNHVLQPIPQFGVVLGTAEFRGRFRRPNKPGYNEQAEAEQAPPRQWPAGGLQLSACDRHINAMALAIVVWHGCATITDSPGALEVRSLTDL